MDIDDIVVDDGALLADRLVRSLHRNEDGHLAGNQKAHELAIEATHNVAILYIYTVLKDEYMLHEHYVYSSESCNYKQWRKIAHDETDKLNANHRDDYIGVYGWATARVKITPLRNGDLFITIDNDGARGVRLSFSPTQAQRKAQSKKAHEKR